MKIYITGGTGVLGRRLLPMLIKDDHDLGILSRSSENNELIRNLGGIPIECDLFDKDSIVESINGYDAILHLATSIPRKNRTSAKDWELNTRIRHEGTDNLVEGALKNKIKLFVLQGVTFSYGHRNGDWVDEETVPTVPVPTAVPLSREFQDISDSNVIMEEKFLDEIKENGLPGIILRFAWFYSHDSTNIPGMVKRKFPLTGDGEAYWNLINVNDAAQAIRSAVNNYESNVGKTYNIVDDEPVKVKDLLQYVADLTGNKTPPKMPEKLVKMYTGSQGINFYKSSLKIKNNKSKTDLGWSPKFPTYREGFKHEIEKYFE